jgi:hypothetical protein
MEEGEAGTIMRIYIHIASPAGFYGSPTSLHPLQWLFSITSFLVGNFLGKVFVLGND